MTKQTTIVVIGTLRVNMFQLRPTFVKFSQYYRDQTGFFMHEHSPGPVGGVENRGRRPRFSIPPKGPGEC